MENKRLFQKQSAFAKGESFGWMLALLVRTNTSPSSIVAIRLPGGEISSFSATIVNTFRQYYASLYKSKCEEGTGEIDILFGKIDVPVLTEKDRGTLEAPITLEELR